jgi:hypothetical protein
LSSCRLAEAFTNVSEDVCVFGLFF